MFLVGNKSNVFIENVLKTISKIQRSASFQIPLVSNTYIYKYKIIQLQWNKTYRDNHLSLQFISYNKINEKYSCNLVSNVCLLREYFYQGRLRATEQSMFRFVCDIILNQIEVVMWNNDNYLNRIFCQQLDILQYQV